MAKFTKFEGLKKIIYELDLEIISGDEIEIFITKGLDTDLSDIYSTNSGELISVLKDGSIHKTIVHISDVSNYRENWGLPKYHIFHCWTLEKMKKKGREYRYKKAGRTDGQFWMVNEKNSGHQTLDFCHNCLSQYDKCYSNHTPFNLQTYMTLPFNHQGPKIKIEADMTTIPKSYAKDWDKISRGLKTEREWICEQCRKDFSDSVLQRYLQVHHIDADISNNKKENLKVLCIECHAEEFQHGHIKASREYKGYMTLPLNHQGPKIKIEADMTTIPKSHAKDWAKISRGLKTERGWVCEQCRKDFSDSVLQRYLHVHHINADISNNKKENLKVLCVECHAEEFQHGHIKASREYKEYMTLPFNHQGPKIEIEADMTTIPKSYEKDWDKISQDLKTEREWICEQCRKDFSDSVLQRYLEVHHIDADISNNKKENLKVLCIECQHGRIKISCAYKE